MSFPPPPTLQCTRMMTQEEAVRALEAVWDGRLSEYPVRLGEAGAQVIRPGFVYIVRKNGPSNITRWTDGLKGTSGSRKRGPAGKHATCYLIPNPPARSSVPPAAAWIRKVFLHSCMRNGSSSTWMIIAYDFERHNSFGRSLLSVEAVLGILPSRTLQWHARPNTSVASATEQRHSSQEYSEVHHGHTFAQISEVAPSRSSLSPVSASQQPLFRATSTPANTFINAPYIASASSHISTQYASTRLWSFSPQDQPVYQSAGPSRARNLADVQVLARFR